MSYHPHEPCNACGHWRVQHNMSTCSCDVQVRLESADSLRLERCACSGFVRDPRRPFKGMTWWRFGPDDGRGQPECFVCTGLGQSIHGSDDLLSVRSSFSSMAHFRGEHRRTLLVALMMAEGIEEGIIDLVRTGREGTITIEEG